MKLKLKLKTYRSELTTFSENDYFYYRCTIAPLRLLRLDLVLLLSVYKTNGQSFRRYLSESIITQHGVTKTKKTLV